VAPDSGHAIGLRSIDGVEFLVHIGIDTVNLAGRGFYPRVRVGDQVRAGDELVGFDVDVITEAGYSLVTPVLVTNSGQFGSVTPVDGQHTRVGAPLLSIEPAAEPA
jgi:PTS system beta-glucosides-specific IIC component